MARIDVCAERTADLLLDAQANVLSGLNTRFVVSLRRIADAPLPARRLNPVFAIGGEDYAMLTQFAAALLRRELGKLMTSMIAEDTAIGNAIDILLFEFRTDSVCEQRSVWQGGVHAHASIARTDVNKTETDEGNRIVPMCVHQPERAAPLSHLGRESRW